MGGRKVDENLYRCEKLFFADTAGRYAMAVRI